MNVFVLSTGRTGTLSLERACKYIQNYSCSHESRCSHLGSERLNFPDQHIEIDNRLSWYSGRLNEMYGDNAVYVHMVRDPESVARSYLKRWNRETSIIRAYAYGILKRQEHQIGDPLEICRDYVSAVNENIETLLKDKSKKMIFRLETAEDDFRKFWDLIGAEGDLDSAISSFSEKHNSSEESKRLQDEPVSKVLRVIKKFPSFVRNA